MVNKEILKDYIQRVVFSGISAVQAFLKENERVYITQHYDFPYIKKKEIGFDEISKYYVLGGPKEYQACLMTRN
ncbi:hypothetical protein Q0V21_25190 [Paenibacillus sp. 11B]|uniref:hypothetical protein n=1 Tax=unclassified Paenibacillus TaxID=185978 RepID=UPI00264F07EA|nr:hypothetical protein [Paenibacillus sp. 11B]MDN8592046.1 hypothetical protein [Paenibacillus sp. 11B]